MNMLLEALSDGRNGPLAFVADWRAALAGLDEPPAALICCAALVAIVVLMFAGPGGWRVRYRRGRFLSANEKSFLRALDVALGRDYAHPVIMRSSRVQALHVPRRISGITLSLEALLYA